MSVGACQWHLEAPAWGSCEGYPTEGRPASTKIALTKTKTKTLKGSVVNE